jgi:hypothetical protein
MAKMTRQWAPRPPRIAAPDSPFRALRGRDTPTVSINSACASGEPQGPLPPHPRPVGTTTAEASPRQEAGIRSATAHLIPVQKSALLTRQPRREAQHASETILRAGLCTEVVGTRRPIRGGRGGAPGGWQGTGWYHVPGVPQAPERRGAAWRAEDERQGTHRLVATPPAGVVSKSGISQRGRGRLPPQAGDLSGTLATAAQLVPSRMGRAPSTSLGSPAPPDRDCYSGATTPAAWSRSGTVNSSPEP